MSLSAADVMCSVAIFGECPVLFSAQVTDAHGKRAGQLNCSRCKRQHTSGGDASPMECTVRRKKRPTGILGPGNDGPAMV